jgi:opacity protein-like surface antigen
MFHKIACALVAAAALSTAAFAPTSASAGSRYGGYHGFQAGYAQMNHNSHYGTLCHHGSVVFYCQ